MSSMKDAIKKSKELHRPYAIQEMMIEQILNKLFYTKKRPKAEQKFMEHILNRDGEQQERYGLHASAIIDSENHFCFREQVLSLFFKQVQGENIKIHLKRIYEEGNAIHEKWQRLFIRGRFGKWSDMDRSRFCEEYDLSYTPDAIINNEAIAKILEDELDIPVEIKSMNGFAFKKARGHAKGEKQLMFYMYLLKKKWGIVLCENKNSQEIKVFIVRFDKEKIRPYIRRLKDVQEAKQEFIEEKKMPPRMCKNCNTKRAQECNMRDACFNVGMGRIRLEVKQ